MNTVRKMYEHLDWANRRILEALETAEHLEGLRLFAHILQAEQVWVSRIVGRDTSQVSIWPEGDLSFCSALMEKNKEDFQKLFDQLSDDQLKDTVSYVNSKGTAFKTRLDDILIHVALHGQYHRGQINTRLRASGLEPVNTDYIFYVR
ncbi:DinB family protein [Ammoniphilus sp. CFH 90114]|uniref:DinB family protein n=1 Tax=Ammoniphilus sp. CFH 90114 TaxID=2493665 RepID=UPI00100DDDA4|nr:DinB family protein [Ammoniphilus sp. CFH 90114]RXT07184.1 damage-inducible protein DinB [Ammoniphilus sp. CFH 90114]